MTSILEEGKNCWKLSKAERFSLLIDGDAYFTALHDSLLRASRCTMLSGWDFHSRMALLHNNEGPEDSSRLRHVLDEAAKATPDLQTYVLAWDYAMLYALEREPLSVFNFAWRSHSRVHFSMDGQHPFGASHHQKLAVLDDRIAYCGGLDITQRRWDTNEHRIHDQRRTDPSGERYGPFHDMQAVVEGEPAYWLGQFIRGRWLQATGKDIEPTAPEPNQWEDADSPWPKDVAADLRDIRVGIARTVPRFKNRPETKEIEQLLLDAIAAAKQSIYIENQYLAAPRVVDALARRLAGESPPEVVVLLPRHCTGWLEEQVMNTLRVQALKTLREADHTDRCRLFFLSTDKEGEHTIKVHAKCLFTDDMLFTLGSANLSNRSMGLDTECNLVVEADSREARSDIAAIRARLLAEHLQAPVDEVQAALESDASLLQTLDSFPDSRLQRLEPQLDKAIQEFPNELVRSLDPEQPIAMDKFLDEIVEDEQGLSISKMQLFFTLLTLLGIGVVVFWRVSPWGDAGVVYSLDQTAMTLRVWPWTPVLVAGAFALAGVVPLPIIVLTIATTLVFNPLATTLYLLSGTLLGATAGYFTGSIMGDSAIRHLVDLRLNRLSRRLAKGGFKSVLLSRLLPLMPFSMINLAAGASRTSFPQFLLGTILGLAPAFLAVVLAAEGLREVLLAPSWDTTTLLLLGAALAFSGLLLLESRLEPPRGETAGNRPDS